MCFNNVYKILTKILLESLYPHLVENERYSDAQKRCVKNLYGCKDHLITSNLVPKDYKNNLKQLSLATENILLSWIVEPMNICWTSSMLLSFISKIMAPWKTDVIQLALTVKGTKIKTCRTKGLTFSTHVVYVQIHPKLYFQQHRHKIHLQDLQTTSYM